jgi:hypothetical protein
MDAEGKEARMADLIAIGYPDETTALAAMDEAERLHGLLAPHGRAAQDPLHRVILDPADGRAVLT